MSLIPTPASLFFTKNDPHDVRLGQWTKSLTLQGFSSTKPDFVFWGYPDDEGIKLNGGRLGASEGPEKIRSFFYKMTPHPLKAQPLKFGDLGDVPTDLELKDRHELGKSLAAMAVTNKVPFITFGGGHDYGYADAAGFLKAHLNGPTKPLVLNFDAHLDVRSTDRGLNSGTPFYRLLTEFKGQFDFYELGIQPQCNSRTHWKWVLDQGGQILPLETISRRGLLQLFQETLEADKTRPVFLSVDIDAFTSAQAPGCSQSWATGLAISDFLPALAYLKNNFDCQGLGIYEVSPPLDVGNMTSKLAALITHHFIFGSPKENE